MAVRTSKSTPRHRGFLGFLRTMWQRKPNTVPPEAAPLVLPHEATNQGKLPMLLSERRYATKEATQRLGPYLALPYLVIDASIEDKEKPNLSRRELLAYIPRLLRAGQGSEAPNPRALLLALIAQHPPIDSKLPADHAATESNKEVIPPFQMDLATARRAEFIRKEILRGVFNEGFTTEEMPLVYRTFDEYTASDAKESRFFDKYLDCDSDEEL